VDLVGEFVRTTSAKPLAPSVREVAKEYVTHFRKWPPLGSLSISASGFFANSPPPTRWYDKPPVCPTCCSTSTVRPRRRRRTSQTGSGSLLAPRKCSKPSSTALRTRQGGPAPFTFIYGFRRPRLSLAVTHNNVRTRLKAPQARHQAPVRGGQGAFPRL
jgi:hypothetical protein